LRRLKASAALPLAKSRVILRLEARADLVTASVFKTDVAPRERRLGEFDSHAFPLLELAWQQP